MPRNVATSITLSAAVLLAGYCAFAQDPPPNPPTVIKGGPVPYGLPPATATFQAPGRTTLTIADDASLNRERELNRQTAALVEKYGQAKEAKDKAELEKELAKSVAEHFTLRQDMREKELLELEDQLKRLRAVHSQRTSEKDRIVADRVQQLLRESSGLGWGNDSASPKGNVLYYTTPDFAAPTYAPAPRLAPVASPVR